jgi:hypothetical protein
MDGTFGQMVTKMGGLALRHLSSWITSCSQQRKKKGKQPITLPVSPYAIPFSRKQELDGDSSTDDETDCDDDDDDKVQVQVQLREEEEEYQFVADHIVHESSTANLLIPEKYLNILRVFISANFCCKECGSDMKEDDMTSVKVCCACSLFWKCSNLTCTASDNIIAKKARKEVSDTFRCWHPEVPACLGDYDINRQIVLACQLSGGGAQMISTFSGLMSLSRPSIWLDNFTVVEQMIGKAQIGLRKTIIKENLQAKIDIIPINREQSKAMLTLMMDGGWDQHASGKTYNSASGRVVSIRPRTGKVCGLVYYSRR